MSNTTTSTILFDVITGGANPNLAVTIAVPIVVCIALALIIGKFISSPPLNELIPSPPHTG